MARSQRDRVIPECSVKPGSVEDYSFGGEVAVFKVAGKMFALVSWARRRAASASSAIWSWRPGWANANSR